MIFLCGNCQAKYQLPDERVAGRTVRMKCRKCAHMIEAKGPPLESLAKESPAPQKNEGESLAPKAPSSAPSEGWYAGIEGKPTGPLSVPELASKLEAGLVTEETLLWREGLEGWKPLAAIAELASLLPGIEESAKEPEAQPAIFEPPPPPRMSEAPPRPSIAGIPRPPPARPSAPRASFVPTASSRLSAAPKLEPVVAEEPVSAPKPAPVALAKEEVSEPPPASEPMPVAQLASVPIAAAPEPPKAEPEPAAVFAEPLPSTAQSAERAESLVVPIPAARRRIHPAAWVVVGLGGVLVGVVAGISLAEKPKPEVQIVTVSVPVEPPPAPSAIAETPSETEDEVAKEEEAKAEAPAEPSSTSKPAPEGRQRAAAPSAPKQSNQAAPAMTGLSSLSGLNAGPTPGPSKGSSTGGGGALSQAEVERVVQSHRAFVKRRCWELALATKTQGAPSSARVMTSITIAPNGRVTNASATGGDGYPGLSSCVAGQVRGWKFPPSEGGTVNVPFVFAAQ